MAESSNCLIQFDSILLDVNENASKSEYQHISNVEQHESVSSQFDNLTLCESSDSCQPSFNSFEKCVTVDEIQTDKLDLSSQNVNDEISSSGILDPENSTINSDKFTNISGFNWNLSNGNGVMLSEFKCDNNGVIAKDEEFHDAVQFFKDPSSLNFLENSGGTTETFNPRSSLFMNFDPLHAKFNTQASKISNELKEISEDDASSELQENTAENKSDSTLINKHLSGVTPRHSLGNVLISFDSPITSNNSITVEDLSPAEPPKLYTEEEFHQALKIQELIAQETFLKRQHDIELEKSQMFQEMEAKISTQNILSSSLHAVLKEVMEVVAQLSDKEKNLQLSLENSEKENTKLKEDLKTSVEDLQSVESTFSDFHKRYEQCKSMLKTYTQNEDIMKQKVENLNAIIQEKDEMYKALQSRTEEMLDKANSTISKDNNMKKASDAQVAVLKAQLKKAELKISSLESDVKHVKIENDKLSSICDDLMAKVSEA